MENQISEDVMKDRFDRLLEEVQTIGRKCHPEIQEVYRKYW